MSHVGCKHYYLKGTPRGSRGGAEVRGPAPGAQGEPLV